MSRAPASVFDLPEPMRAIAIAKFWERIVRREGCWGWNGSRMTRAGELSYSLLIVGRRDLRMLAHRAAWEITVGPIPDGQVACHRCDNPPCPNPHHLFLGAQADNLADMRAKGRGHVNTFPSGHAHPNAKLNEELVRAIRMRRDDGAALALIGAEFGLDPSTVHDIVRRRTWKHVA